MPLVRLRTLTQNMTALLSLLPTGLSFSANINTIWGLVDAQPELHSFSLAYDKNQAQGLQLPQASANNNPDHRLHFLKGFRDSQSKITHLRYEQYYQGMPVWGAQLIYHLSPNTKPWVTGKLVNGLETDLKYTEHKIPKDKALTIALNKHKKLLSAKPKITAIIYVLKKKPNTAITAYHIMYGGSTAAGKPALHEFIINAHTGQIIKYWNGLHTRQVGGTGPGGVLVNNLPYRSGKYQFGNLTPGVNTLGVINVNYNGVNTCTISNSQFVVINLENQVIDTENGAPLPGSAFSYHCNSPNYTNLDDKGSAPINNGISPINDVTYFTQAAFDMYKNTYQVAYPIGNSRTSLPVRSFTHLGDFDNAFACDIDCVQSSGYGGNTQIMVYGNGMPPPKGESFPLTNVEMVGHEFSHLVTAHFSNLIYANQSGGMNEAFSDMAAIAIQSYINSINSSFKIWNGPAVDSPYAWTIGLAVSATTPAVPLRYLNNPPLDGKSIENAANYRPGMNPHYSSGVFNKAFFLLSTTKGWTVERAFRVMLDANMSYWIPSATFEYGACGVIQSALNRGYNSQDVINAFKKVGVNCPSKCWF